MFSNLIKLTQLCYKKDVLVYFYIYFFIYNFSGFLNDEKINNLTKSIKILL